MFPLFSISIWRPFAPAELPAFFATMGTSDSPAPPPSPSLFTLVGGCAMFRADAGVSLVTAQSLCQARYGLRSRVVNTPGPFYSAPCLLLPAGVPKPSAPSNAVISGLHPSRSALSVTIAPRLLSCLRIKQPIAGLPARLDTWPGASSYQDRIHTRSIVRHCQAATAT